MKKILLVALAIIFYSGSFAQNRVNPWAIGMHAGYSGYKGDLGDNIFYKFKTEKGTFGITLGRYVSPFVDVVAHASYSDWDYKKNDLIGFNGNYFNYGLRLHLKLNNGKLLKEDARIAPYFVLGSSAVFAHSEYTVDGRTSAMSLDLGYGVKVRLNRDLHFQLQSVFGVLKNDEIDGLRNGRGDRWAQHTLGFIFSFPIHTKKDSDGDGVPDWKDACPNTAMGVKVSDTGCPADTDGDGVPDYFDRCPDVKGLIEMKGCPDTDGDGVADNMDKCPTMKGTVDLKGCPDSDGDGIGDADDKCPTVKGTLAGHGCPDDADGDGVTDDKDACPSVKGKAALNGCPDKDNDGVADKNDACPDVAGTVENKGCPAINVEDQKKLDVLIKNINFKTGSDVILTTSYTALDKAAEVLNSNASYRLDISGHTDNVGDAKKNLELSARRANAVKNYLAKKGIAAERLNAMGFGDTMPLVPNNSVPNRATNRRVELKLKY